MFTYEKHINSFDTFSQNWLSRAQIRTRDHGNRILWIFLKTKTSPRACSVPVHWQRQQKAARWTRATKKGRRNLLLQVCRCWRSDRENEREQRRKEGHSGDPSLCTDLPLLLLYPTLDKHWRSTFLESPLPTLLSILRASLRHDKFSHIFEKIRCTPQKDNAKTRPFFCNSLHQFLELLFREAGSAGFYTGIFVRSRSFRRLKWPVFVWHKRFSRRKNEREMMPEFKRDVKGSIIMKLLYNRDCYDSRYCGQL